MENLTLLEKLRRITIIGFSSVAFAVLLLASQVPSSSRLLVVILGAAAMLSGLAYVLVSIRRRVAPVIMLAEQLTVENERLSQELPGNRFDTELNVPFERLVESQRKLRRAATARSAALRAELERLSTVLNSMDEGVIAIDEEERLILANDASRRLIQFTKGAAPGRSFLEVTRNWSLCESLRQCLSTGRTQNREITTTHTPVRTLSLQASCLPGEPTPGAVVVLHDITELRRLENLRHEFVANVSHELKTPLAAIMAYAETLKMGAVNDREHNMQFVSRIEEQAERLHQLIQDILQIARVESGQEVFDIAPLPLHVAVEATTAQHQDAARRKELELNVSIEAEAYVMADEDGLQTIVDNLVSNAIKYTPAGGHIGVTLRVVEGMALIDVSDTGIGISEENLPRVFERFFRADKARARSMISTGLGLSIVKHLVQAFGGSVAVSSSLGEGSVFSVTLPKTDPSAPA